MEEKTFAYNVTDGTLDFYPVKLHDATLIYGEGDDESVQLPEALPLMGNWAKGGKACDSEGKFPLPTAVDIAWLSITEKKFFYCYEELQKDLVEALWEQKDEKENPLFNTFVVGIAPRGRVAMWVQGPRCRQQILWAESAETDIPMDEFIPQRPDLTRDDYCQYYLDNMPEVAQNMQNIGLPSATELDDRMKQYIYRYQIQLQHYDADEKKWQNYPEGTELPVIQNVQNMCTDSSFDRIGGARLTNYHRAAQPISICIKWIEGESSDYSAYLYLNPALVQPLIELACIEDEEEPFDIELKIDSNQYKFQVILRSQWIPKGLIIPDDMIQILVFRAGSEIFRSQNFKLSSGAWTW